MRSDKLSFAQRPSVNGRVSYVAMFVCVYRFHEQSFWLITSNDDYWVYLLIVGTYNKHKVVYLRRKLLMDTHGPYRVTGIPPKPVL